MEIRYNRTGTERKALVAAVSEITGVKAVYLGAPGFSFAVGVVIVDRYGTLTFGGGTTTDEVRDLVAELKGVGFTATETIGLEESGDADVEQDAITDSEQKDGEVVEEVSPADHDTDQEDIDSVAIEFPLQGFTELAFANLENLIASKATLIRKALGISALPVERLEDRIRFPWLPADASTAMVAACSRLIAALCDTAKFQKRVTAQEKPVENERYAMRCFLLRLGFIGDEYGPARKLLLANLTGDGSYKGGKGRKHGDRETAAAEEDGGIPVCDAYASELSEDNNRYDSLVRGGLCRVPPTDCNYTSYLRDATDKQLHEAIAIMEAAPDGHKGRIAACQRELGRRNA
jgi:hypothetical protein